MRGPPLFAVIIFALAVCIPVGCGKKAAPAPAGDDAAAAPPAPTPTPKPVPPDPRPDDGITPLFPFGKHPTDPAAGKGNEPAPKVDVPTPVPDPVPPPKVVPDPNPQGKKDPPKDPVPPPVPPPVDPKLPPPKVDDKDKKEPMKQGSAIVWPTEIGGKDAKAYLKDLSDPDPAVRVIALQTLPLFGPAAKKTTTPDGKLTYGKAVLVRMSGETESDPWVRLEAFKLVLLNGFEDEADMRAAVLLLGKIADGNPSLRLQAIKALAVFGPRGEPAVPFIVGGQCVNDPSYETRRALAETLGIIGTDEKTGPSPKALACLVNVLIHDKSAAVRLDAMQALVLLGPPNHKTMVPDPKDRTKMVEVHVPDQAAAKKYLDAVKRRLAPYAPKPGEPKTNDTGVAESNKQVEIWARVVLMRFDPADEVNKENLDAITKYLKGTDYAAKVQALFVLGLLGEYGARRIDDVIRELADDDPYIVYAALTALAKMGEKAKPAIPDIEKLRDRGKTEEEKKYYVMIADEAIKVIKDPPKAPDPKEKK